MKTEKLITAYLLPGWKPVLLLTAYSLLLTGCGLHNPFSPPRPYAPDLISPQDGDTVATVQVQWSVVRDMEYYNLQIDEQSDFSSPDVDTSIGHFIFKVDTGLTDKRRYYWRVRVKIEEIEKISEWSKIWWFYLDRALGNHPPNKPDLPSPPDGAIDISLRPILGWRGGDIDRDVVTYKIYLGKDSARVSDMDEALRITTIIDSSRVDTTFRSYPVQDSLDYGSRYFWKVRAIDEHNHHNEGGLWRFTTGTGDNNPPLKPETPTGNMLSYTDEYAEFTTSTTDPDGDNISYMFEFGDGEYGNWTDFYPSGVPVTDLHQYQKLGFFDVRARAKDTYHAASEWSDAHRIEIKGGPGTCWIVDEGNDALVRISEQGNRFFSYDVGLNPITAAVDQRDGSCWVVSVRNHRVRKISPDGTEVFNTHLYQYYGECNPTSVAINQNDQSAWITLITDPSWTSRVIHLDRDGNPIRADDIIIETGMSAICVAIDITREKLWVGVVKQVPPLSDGYVVKFDYNGTEKLRITGIVPVWVDVNPDNGDCWALDVTTGNNRVVRITVTGDTTIYTGFDFGGVDLRNPALSSLAIDHIRGVCWIANTQDDEIVRINWATGERVSFSNDISRPRGIDVNYLTGDVWVSNEGDGTVVRLSADGEVLNVTSGFGVPLGIAVSLYRDP